MCTLLQYGALLHLLHCSRVMPLSTFILPNMKQLLISDACYSMDI
jgi:hypothetical protein